MGRRGKEIVKKSSIIVQLREALSNEELHKVALLVTNPTHANSAFNI